MNCSQRENKLAFCEHGLTQLSGTCPVPVTGISWFFSWKIWPSMVLWREWEWATAHLRWSWTSCSTQNHPAGVFQLLFARVGTNLPERGREMGKATREVSAPTYPDPPLTSKVLSNIPSTAASCLGFFCGPKSHVLDTASQLQAHGSCHHTMLHEGCSWPDHKLLGPSCAQTSSGNMAQTNDTLMILQFFLWFFFFFLEKTGIFLAKM